MFNIKYVLTRNINKKRVEQTYYITKRKKGFF